MAEMTDTEAEQSMRLPTGKTCADCVHIRRCTAFGFTDSPENVWCDFYPNKFQAQLLPMLKEEANV